MLPDTWVALICLGIVIALIILLKCIGFWEGCYTRYQERNNEGAEGRDTEQYAARCGLFGDLMYCIIWTLPCNTCFGTCNRHDLNLNSNV